MTPPSDHHLFWQNCLEQVRGRFDAITYDAFLAPVSAQQSADGLALVCPNRATERWLKENLGEWLQERASEHFGGAPARLRYHIAPAAAGVAARPAPAVAALAAATPATGLRKALSFDSFVPGEANNICLTAGLALAGGDLRVAPLFIEGGTGLGKTHLAHAIGNEYASPRRRALYIESRSFMGEVVNMCRLGRYDAFRERFHTLDMLIIDDIQHLAGNKPRVQEELFSLFNALHENDKPIVITGDCSPFNIKGFEDSLRTRFCCGVVAQMRPPEFDLRVGILLQKAKQIRFELPLEVAKFVAEQIHSNVRELEGALRRIAAMARFKNEKVGIQLCRDALADIIGRAEAAPSIDQIKDQVTRFYGLRAGELLSKTRRRSVALPRHVCAYLCRRHTAMSLPEIGAALGKRNHTTVLHSCRLIESRLAADKKLADELRRLSALLRR